VSPEDKVTEQQAAVSPVDSGDSEELYEEPARMTVGDSIGVAVAIVLLALIGWAGYLWLTPGRSVADMLHFGQRSSPAETTAMADSAADDMSGMDSAEHAHQDSAMPIDDDMDGQDMSSGDMAGMDHEAMADMDQDDMQGMDMTPPSAAEGSPGADSGQGEEVAAEVAPTAAADQPHLHDHEFKCAYCGMFTDRSMSQVVAYWTDGTHTHHDGWDCLFNYQKDNGLTLDHALVKHYGSSTAEPQWLNAADAWYRYDTKPIKGSMPPFVAAFATKAEAEGAAAELEGTLMNFAELKAKW